jgi:hypothetical protein
MRDRRLLTGLALAGLLLGLVARRRRPAAGPPPPAQPPPWPSGDREPRHPLPTTGVGAIEAPLP